MLEGQYIQCPPSHDGLPLQFCFKRACCDDSSAAFRPLNLIVGAVRRAASASEPCLCCFACLISHVPWPVLIVDPCRTKAVVIPLAAEQSNSSARSVVGTSVAKYYAISSRRAPASSRLVLHKERHDILTITGKSGRCLRSRP